MNINEQIVKESALEVVTYCTTRHQRFVNLEVVEGMIRKSLERAIEETPSFIEGYRQGRAAVYDNEHRRCQRLKEQIESDLVAERKRREQAEREVNELNNLLRAVGWGQGEIDSAATIAEENDKLREQLLSAQAALKELQNERAKHKNLPKM